MGSPVCRQQARWSLLERNSGSTFLRHRSRDITTVDQPDQASLMEKHQVAAMQARFPAMDSDRIQLLDAAGIADPYGMTLDRYRKSPRSRSKQRSMRWIQLRLGGGRRTSDVGRQNVEIGRRKVESCKGSQALRPPAPTPSEPSPLKGGRCDLHKPFGVDRDGEDLALGSQNTAMAPITRPLVSAVAMRAHSVPRRTSTREPHRRREQHPSTPP